MALPVSEYGCFQITGLSFSPSIIACEESTTVTVKLKNTSGMKVSKCCINAAWVCPKAGGGGDISGDVFLIGGPDYTMLETVNWTNGTEREFTGLIWKFCSKQKDVLDKSQYVFDPARTNVRLNIYTDVTLPSGMDFDAFDDIAGSAGEYLTVLLERDNPRLSVEIQRTPDDESVNVKTTARLTADKELSVLNAHGYTIRLYATDAHSPALTTDTVIPFAPTLSTLFAGITNSTDAITSTFSNGTDWYFLLVVSNGYETAKAYSSISRAFANVHLSGCSTGGVAFGKFSGATEGNPIFECEYPAYFNGGIAVGFADKFHAVNVSRNVSATTSLANKGLSITIPARSYYALSAYAGYNSKKSSVVILSKGASNVNDGVIADATAGNTYSIATAVGYTEEDLTLYVWAKWVGSDPNASVWIRGFYITP